MDFRHLKSCDVKLREITQNRRNRLDYLCVAL
jgi:hypothetical protein